jgi:hypothetical protein
MKKGQPTPENSEPQVTRHLAKSGFACKVQRLRLLNSIRSTDYDFITSSMSVCDVIPNPPNTPFLQEARKRSAKMLDGLGMLVHQGAIGFKLWTKKKHLLQR